MEISANVSQSQINTQQTAERARDDNKVQLETEQTNAQVESQDRTTTAEPVEQSSASEQTQNRNNEQVSRQQEQAPSPDESIGGQLDIRA